MSALAVLFRQLAEMVEMVPVVSVQVLASGCTMAEMVAAVVPVDVLVS